jgi:hypothetical protein
MVTGQRNNGRRQPSASNISGKGRQSNSDHQEPNETIHKQNDTYGTQIQGNGEEEQNQEGEFLPISKHQTIKMGDTPSNQDHQQSKQQSKHNVRASISKEITTA